MAASRTSALSPYALFRQGQCLAAISEDRKQARYHFERAAELGIPVMAVKPRALPFQDGALGRSVLPVCDGQASEAPCVQDLLPADRPRYLMGVGTPEGDAVPGQVQPLGPPLDGVVQRR